jgi:hypothetical protein
MMLKKHSFLAAGMHDLAVLAWNFGEPCEEYWDGYKYSNKTTRPAETEVIDFYNRTDFVVYWG